MAIRFSLWLGALADRAQNLRKEDGQAMVEYALILGLVSVVAISVLTVIGTDVRDIFQKIEDALAAAL